MKNPVIHFELPASDRERVKAFYTKAFGWEMNQLGPEMGDYVVVKTTETDENNMIKNPGAINGGIFQKHAVDPMGQYPSVVISVENLEVAMENIKSSGGSIHGTPYDIPGVGRFVSFVDTEGNRISILEPKKM